MLPLLLQPRPMAIEAAAPVLFAAARHGERRPNDR
jgi:hypothetical protein